MEDILVPTYFGVFIQATVYYVNEFANKRNFDWRMIAALVGGVALSVVFQQDLFADYAAMVPYVGSVFTGVIFSRVANLTHDVIQRIRK